MGRTKNMLMKGTIQKRAFSVAPRICRIYCPKDGTEGKKIGECIYENRSESNEKYDKRRAIQNACQCICSRFSSLKKFETGLFQVKKKHRGDAYPSWILGPLTCRSAVRIVILTLDEAENVHMYIVHTLRVTYVCRYIRNVRRERERERTQLIRQQM